MSTNFPDKEPLLAKIFDSESQNALIVALDDSATSGPEGGLADMGAAIQLARDAGANAILGHYGTFREFGDLLNSPPVELESPITDRREDSEIEQRVTAGILSITMGTNTKTPKQGALLLKRSLVGDVSQAEELGLQGVAVKVHTQSPFESEMLTFLGQAVRSGNELGVPVLAQMHPIRLTAKGEADYFLGLLRTNPNEYARRIRHAARIAVEAGTDIVEVPYTGSGGSFESLVNISFGKPVLAALEPSIPKLSNMLRAAEDAMKAGARGIVTGRKLFERPVEDQKLALVALGEIVHNKRSSLEALDISSIVTSDHS